jgi:hypothetical protein
MSGADAPHMKSSVTISPDGIVVHELELRDPQLTAFVADRDPAERVALVERALRIGLMTICNAGVSLTTDVVKAEFARLTERLEQTHARAAEALEQQLRANFGDTDGRLPRTLETFLGDEGKLHRLVGDLFDPNRREGAMGQLTTLLAKYFDGDASQLARLLDPTREGSPLHQFRNEMTGEFRLLRERLAALEAGEKARVEERAKGTAKGGDFEDALEARLGEMARGLGDLLERTGAEAGDALRNKKGDFVLGIDPTRTRGVDLRVVIEAKGRTVSLRRFSAELAEAKENRRAAVALAVFTPAGAPTGVAPLTVIGSDVYCVYDPEADDATALEAAVRLARALALASLRESSVQLDVPAVQEALAEIVRQVGEVTGMKSRMTSISNAATDVSRTLDAMRMGILRSVKDVEAQLEVVDSPAGTDAPALSA